MTKSKNIADWIRAKVARDPELADIIGEEEVNAQIAQQVRDFRKMAGLTQAELADVIGTKQSVISRIEDADYSGHSLSTLRKIAMAVNAKLRVEFYAPVMPASSHSSSSPVAAVIEGPVMRLGNVIRISNSSATYTPEPTRITA